MSDNDNNDLELLARISQGGNITSADINKNASTSTSNDLALSSLLEGTTTLFFSDDAAQKKDK